MKPIFITGTGTNVGKTLIAAIIVEALHADYWKPVQAGFSEGTDSSFVKNIITNTSSVIHPELYKLHMPASPHIAAKEEGKKISIKNIIHHLPKTKNRLVIEGAGGLMVPFNTNKFVLDLIKKLQAKVIVVSKNELGSINHSLLTAYVLKKENIPVVGWIFNDSYLNYEHEIEEWSGFPAIASVPHIHEISKKTLQAEVSKIKKALYNFLK